MSFTIFTLFPLFWIGVFGTRSSSVDSSETITITLGGSWQAYGVLLFIGDCPFQESGLSKVKWSCKRGQSFCLYDYTITQLPIQQLVNL